MRISPREGGGLDLGQQPAQRRPGRQPELGGQLVAAHERRPAALRPLGERGGEQLAGQLDVAGDGHVRLASAGGEAVGHRESVTSAATRPQATR